MQHITLSSGKKIACHEFGDPAGVPAFYFHGWPSSGIQGQLMDEDAGKLGIRLVSPDRPGLGGSDFQPGRRLLDWPQTLCEVARHYSWEKFHIFGVSGGGPYVYAAALRIPERLLSASVVCGAPPLKVLGASGLFWPYRFMLVIRDHLNCLMNPVFNIGCRISLQAPADIPMRWLLNMLNAEDQKIMNIRRNLDVIAEGFRQSVAQRVAHVQADADIYTSDWGFDLRDVKFPIHLWHGREDRNIPFSYAEKVAAMLPNSITHWTDSDGHYSLAVSRGHEVAETALARQP